MTDRPIKQRFDELKEQMSNDSQYPEVAQIFGTEGCSFCLRAKRLAEREGIEYEYRDVDKEELQETFPTANTFPQIIWHDRWVGGYTEFAEVVEVSKRS